VHRARVRQVEHQASAIRGKLGVVDRLAEDEFENIGPAAKLARRQQAANNAREELEQLNTMMPAQSHKRTLRARACA
jgi:hypothetical protein